MGQLIAVVICIEHLTSCSLAHQAAVYPTLELAWPALAAVLVLVLELAGALLL